MFGGLQRMRGEDGGQRAYSISVSTSHSHVLAFLTFLPFGFACIRDLGFCLATPGTGEHHEDNLTVSGSCPHPGQWIASRKAESLKSVKLSKGRG